MRATKGRRTHLIVSTRRWLIGGILCIAMLGVASPACAYDETGTGRACVECHGSDTPDGSESSGPHGGYTATSKKCATCHSAHKAPADGIVLLPAATVLATCQTCHDGTSGQGVYGVIKARTGVDPADPAEAGAAHRMLDTETDPITAIPGGDSTGGGSRPATFSGIAGGLTCSDCHSPHGSNVVDPFTGDRARSTTDTAGLDSASGFRSTRLLRQRPTSMDPEWPPVTTYGSDWCGACHAGRLSGHAAGTQVRNHPVDSTGTFYYDRVRIDDTTTGPLGRSNAGYVMPGKQANGGYGPICQQCHEDARSVGDDLVSYKGKIAPGEEFNITDIDGLPTDDPIGVKASSDNPRFQVFPHESDNDAFLVETGNDLCTNCHPNK